MQPSPAAFKHQPPRIGSGLVRLVDNPDAVSLASLTVAHSPLDSHVRKSTRSSFFSHTSSVYNRSRVYYVRESLMRQAISVPRANLISLSGCLAKFSKTEKFCLHVTALGTNVKNKFRQGFDLNAFT
ncbi:hypothetical protein RQP46_008743 [Phenoliferia psychrophenolica]